MGSIRLAAFARWLCNDSNVEAELLSTVFEADEPSAADTPEIRNLQAAVKENPDDLQLKVDLAIQLHQANKADEALPLLFGVLKQELSFGDARKVMLDMIGALADGDPLKSEFRRKVYGLLY